MRTGSSYFLLAGLIVFVGLTVLGLVMGHPDLGLAAAIAVGMGVGTVLRQKRTDRRR